MIYIFFKDGSIYTHEEKHIEPDLFNDIDNGTGFVEFILDTYCNKFYWSDGWQPVKDKYSTYLNDKKH